jgi:hypothetical protein
VLIARDVLGAKRSVILNDEIIYRDGPGNGAIPAGMLAERIARALGLNVEEIPVIECSDPWRWSEVSPVLEEERGNER